MSTLVTFRKGEAGFHFLLDLPKQNTVGIFSTTCPVGRGVNVNTGLPEYSPHLLLRVFADDHGAEEARDIVPLYSVIVPFLRMLMMNIRPKQLTCC